MMKLYLKTDHLMAFLILLCIGMTGCKNDDYPEETLESESLIEQRYLSFMTSSLRNGGFFMNEKPDADVLYVINSKKELEKVYTGSIALPDFSLNSYTLIVGRVNMSSNDNYVLIGHDINIADTKGVLNLYFKKSSGSYSDMKQHTFWGLYRKINTNKLAINKVVK